MLLTFLKNLFHHFIDLQVPCFSWQLFLFFRHSHNTLGSFISFLVQTYLQATFSIYILIPLQQALHLAEDLKEIRIVNAHGHSGGVTPVILALWEVETG